MKYLSLTLLSLFLSIHSITCFGQNNYSINFDGFDDYIIVPNSNSLNPSDLTISFWTKLNSYSPPGESGYNHFVNKWDGPNHQYLISCNTTGLYVYLDNQYYQCNTLVLLMSNNRLNLLS